MATPDVNRAAAATLPMLHRIEFRLLVWLAAVALVTLVAFETADVVRDVRALQNAGADGALIAVAKRDAIWLHAIHGVATIAVLVIGVRLLTRRLITGRTSKMLESIHRFRTGSWSLPCEEAPADELGSVVEALRRLGPHLERKLGTFVACDRKATVARLGIAYEASLAPSARRIVARAREGRVRRPADPAWEEIEQSAMHILADMGRLGRPEHPAVASIVEGISPPHRWKAPRRGLVASRAAVAPSGGTAPGTTQSVRPTAERRPS